MCEAVDGVDAIEKATRLKPDLILLGLSMPRENELPIEPCMSSTQNFLDNLENLQLVTSVALDHVQINRDQFAKSATGVQVRQAEKAIYKVRLLMTQLEKEFAIFEYLIAEGGPVGATTSPTSK